MLGPTMAGGLDDDDAAPATGDAVKFSRDQLFSFIQTMNLPMQRACTSASLITPPLPTSLRSASNCGLNRTTSAPSSVRCGSIFGMTAVKEMNDTSTVARPILPGSSKG